MFGIVRELFLRVAFAGAQASVRFISKPNTKNPGGALGRADRSGLPDLETNLSPTFPPDALSLRLGKENFGPQDGEGESDSPGLPL